MKKKYAVGSIEATSKYDNLLRMYNDNVIDLSLLKESKTLIDGKMLRTAGKTVKIAPKENSFLYVRSRAVSAGNVIEHADGTCEEVPLDIFWGDFPKYDKITRGANLNGDWFSTDELRKSAHTFKGVSVFCEHENENVENARGIVLDAVYNENRHFVETLMAIDAEAFPQLARSIKLGYVTSVSMGCTCEISRCSICRHEARADEDVCEHIANYKGMKYNGLNCWESTEGVTFFELSAVIQPADVDAKIMERIASVTPRVNSVVIKFDNDKTNKLLSEQNQRFSQGRINSISEKLKNLPWS